MIKEIARVATVIGIFGVLGLSAWILVFFWGYSVFAGN